MAEPRSFTIVLPLPEPSVSQNGRVHHMRKAKDTAVHKEHAFHLAKQARVRFEKVIVAYRLFFVDNKQRDAVNYMAAAKSYLDGVVKSGAISGDHWQVCSPRFDGCSIDKKKPRIEMTFIEVLDEA